MRKGGIYEAVYRDGGSGRIRLLLRSAPHDVPPAPVARLGFKQALRRTVYAVTFEQSEKYHTHFYPLSEVIRVEETEIEVKDRRKRECQLSWLSVFGYWKPSAIMECAARTKRHSVPVNDGEPGLGQGPNLNARGEVGSGPFRVKPMPR